MTSKKSVRSIDILIRDVNAGTVSILDEHAKQAKLSRNEYLKEILNLIARDSEYNPYNRDRSVELLEKMMPILERNTQALEKFDEWMQQLSTSQEN